MRTRRKVILLGACLAALAFIALLAYSPASREPSYGGHPLNFWVAILGSGSPSQSDREKATTAIDHIGAAALPFLVKWIQGFPPRWKVQLSTWTAHARLAFANRLCNASITRANQLFDGSRYAFIVLGEKAMPARQAFEDLCRLMNETNTPLTAWAAITALSGFGTNALPPLLAVGANTNHPFHLQAQLTASQILRQHAPATNAPPQ